MSRILGINAYHGDSSACLVVDGQLVAAVEEERFRRIKHWAGFPSRSIAYVLQAGGLSLADLDHVGINRDPQANWGPRLKFVMTKRPSLGKLVDRLKNRAKLKSIEEEFAEHFPNETLNAQLHHVQHHRAHLASAGLVSPFDTCVAVSVDQFGFVGGARGRCQSRTYHISG